MIDSLIAKGVLPDTLIRLGIRNLLKKRLLDERDVDIERRDQNKRQLIEKLKESEIAIQTDLANDQHYQVPTAFYDYALGKRKKYSSCSYHKATSLNEAEEEMLALTIKRADIRDGQRILDLGCGWGSASLYIAEHFPNGQITALSNSKTQKEYIQAKAREKNLTNITVVTCNVVDLNLDTTFDRIISIEMFEHMRNYQKLLANIEPHLNQDGKLFIHIFTHRDTPYFFEAKDQTDWMSRYFFSGGIMPSEHLLYSFQDHFCIDEHWIVSGLHYAKTAAHWLQNMDKNKKEILAIFRHHYGNKQAKKWFHYWRVFFMACEELWKYKNGNEWYVTHYLLSKRQ